MRDDSMGRVEQQGEGPSEKSTQMVDRISDSGLDGFLAGYSQKDLEEARIAAAKVVKCAKAVGRSVYDLVIVAADFRDRRFYERFGHKSFDQWYSNEGFAPSALKKYMEIYDHLTTEHGIEVEQYQHIDIAKSPGIINLIRAGASSTEMEESLLIAQDMTLEDWIAWSDGAVENKKAGLGVGTPREYRQQKSKHNYPEGIEPGYYFLVRVTHEDIGRASPETNGALKKMRGLRGDFYLDSENDRMVVCAHY